MYLCNDKIIKRMNIFNCRKVFRKEVEAVFEPHRSEYSDIEYYRLIKKEEQKLWDDYQDYLATLHFHLFIIGFVVTMALAIGFIVLKAICR